MEVVNQTQSKVFLFFKTMYSSENTADVMCRVDEALTSCLNQDKAFFHVSTLTAESCGVHTHWCWMWHLLCYQAKGSCDALEAGVFAAVWSGIFLVSLLLAVDSEKRHEAEMSGEKLCDYEDGFHGSSLTTIRPHQGLGRWWGCWQKLLMNHSVCTVRLTEVLHGWLDLLLFISQSLWNPGFMMLLMVFLNNQS